MINHRTVGRRNGGIVAARKRCRSDGKSRSYADTSHADASYPNPGDANADSAHSHSAYANANTNADSPSTDADSHSAPCVGLTVTQQIDCCSNNQHKPCFHATISRPSVIADCFHWII